MKYINKFFLLLVGVILIMASSCSEPWEDHNERTVLSANLYELIGQDTSLSTFYGYLQKTGYDQILTSNETYTVYAPNNAALSNLDKSIVNSDSLLKRFVGNHIAYNEYPTDISTDSVKIKMVNGKNLKFISGSVSINGSTLISYNTYCKNGILHIISSPIYPKNSLWEYRNVISDYSISSIKEVLSYYSTSSESTKNIFLTNIADVSNEDSVYTFFILTDDAFTKEYNKMLPYLSDTTDYSAILIDYHTRIDVCKDIVVRGQYKSFADMPDTLLSTEGIKIPKENITIADSYEASNGMVYVVSNFDIPLKNKIPEIKIEGENYFATYNETFSLKNIPLLGIRARSSASGGKDLYIPGGSTGHGIYYLSVGYNTPYLYTLKYKVYWKVINDFFENSGSGYTQKMAINAQSINDIIASSYQGDTLVKLKTVKYITQMGDSELYLGSTTNKEYSKQKIYICSNGASTASPYYNYVSLDYFRLVPDLSKK